MLNRLLKIVSLYQPYTGRLIRLRRQRDWLIQLQRLLEPEPEPSDSQTVQQEVDRYLNQLAQDDGLSETDRAIAQHVVTTFRNRWWGLFVCYDVPGLPATNNKLEGFFGHLKTNQRRISLPDTF